MIVRPAVRADLADIVALLTDGVATVDEAYIRAFETVDADPRNEILVLDDGGAAVGCLQVTYIPGLGRHGQERAHVEAVRIRADRRGAGLGRLLLRHTIDRARSRGCTLMQLTSDRRRDDAHRFYDSLGFVRSHEGFKLEL
ncbi:GNAT family N-acetyltransferase [Actinomadura sp. NEAU-AAG7]|uniref:GNAT family N-acetyltransferase n=1 Tax=Actinomadura sp. NEAU-AAG7 TaxID=2839640 RepID=UPI001BE4DB2E|nr:GNAT family N-acetyltransferase [Actinomadura sp. NEAU-AAG7]MBT2206920.1 GNAT family N-acetyltransferase [Actinomadura sp. NEAU-AAG7]